MKLYKEKCIGQKKKLNLHPFQNQQTVEMILCVNYTDFSLLDTNYGNFVA